MSAIDWDSDQWGGNVHYDDRGSWLTESTRDEE